MNTELANVMFYFFITITFVTAFYNAYMEWFKDDFSLLILILTLIFSLIAAFLKKYGSLQHRVGN